MKIRVKFRKWGCMKFVGHLDMMRYFQKAVRRANIDICYSEGFSPHQIMSFAAPLGVGITSDGEYFDIEVHSTLSSKASIEALNAAMVDGVEVTGYVALGDKAKNAMSIVAAADYELSFKDEKDDPYTLKEWKEKIDTCFNRQESFVITKKTKKSERKVDLKPLVYEFDAAKKEGKTCFFLKVSTGSNDNIKPELVLSSFFEKCGEECHEESMQIHRTEVYARDEETGRLISLLDLGEEITE